MSSLGERFPRLHAPGGIPALFGRLCKSRSVVVALVVAAAFVLPAVSVAAPPKVLLKDDFRQGLDLSSTWGLLSFPPFFLADDGIVTTSNQGLFVRASGTNSETGAPAF